MNKKNWFDWDKEKKWHDEVRNAINNGINNDTIDMAEALAINLADGERNSSLTTSQLRKFFGSVKLYQQQGYKESDLVLLKPKLAYAVGRAKKNNMKSDKLKIEVFQNVISYTIDQVINCPIEKKQNAYHNFIDLFEAIVAYHKQYGKD